MARALLLFVRFHDGRYHGQPEWPPSPARLFQALVAGAAMGMRLSDDDRDAFEWLERLSPPIIHAPPKKEGSGFTNYVPNNDLDAVGGDLGRVGKIRAPKLIKPRLFDPRTPLIYAWTLETGDGQAGHLRDSVVDKLYQLGRGVDMAWAWAEIVDVGDLQEHLTEYGGVLYRPSIEGTEGFSLLCPQQGSLARVEYCFQKTAKRFTILRKGRGLQQLFSKPPKPRFRGIVYNASPHLGIYELRLAGSESVFMRWPLTQACALAVTVRDLAAAKLTEGLPESAALIERTIVGRNAIEADKATRIRIVPLPSIGSVHVTPSIRRVLVEIPPNCPLPSEDIEWAFSGLTISDPETGEILCELVQADNRKMLWYYGASEGHPNASRVWRTITAAALPRSAARRRIDPDRLRHELSVARKNPTARFSEAKGAKERLNEEARACTVVLQALRHAGIHASVESVRVQREPFDSRGSRAEAFASGTRFAKEQLWHVEITFAGTVRGPLLIGDGRYLGLGLMAPLPARRHDREGRPSLPENTGASPADVPRP